MSRPPKRMEHSRSTSKDRASWFYQRAAFPLRDTPPADLEEFWASQSQADIRPDHHWDCMGPFNIAGRVTALVIHPQDPNKWFAGSAAGGVWMTSDAGQSWKPTWSRFANQNIGALAWWNVQPGRLFLVAATGEANMSPDTYPGSGVYVSDDEALTWRPAFGSPCEAASHSEEDAETFPRRIGCMAFHGVDRMALGSVSMDDRLPAGLYLLTEAQGLEPCEFWGDRRYNCHSVMFHPHDPKCLYAFIELGGTQNGVWRSRDGGQSWKHLTNGLPPGDRFRRTSLVFSPSDPDVMYALAADRSNFVLGVFRSGDGGSSWREILGGRFPRERQMSYNNAIAVHPRKPDSVIWGGMHLYRTDNAGRHWRGITSPDRTQPNYVHSDHHAVLWPEHERILSGNDGGVSLSEDGGRTWTERSRGMVTTMFYDMDVAPSNGDVFGGGTQDNGTLIVGMPGVRRGEFAHAREGDGAWLAFDPADERHIFASAANFIIYRHRRNQGWKRVKPRQISEEETSQRAFFVMAMEPSTRKGIKKVWAGTSRLWRTDNDGRSLKPVSPHFDGSAISAIEIAGADRRLMFVGTTYGGVFRSRDGGRTWSQNLTGMGVPRRAITSIQTHPRRAGTVVFTVASTGALSSTVRLGSGANIHFGHVFRSEDGGDTWADIDGGMLPNVVYYAAAYQTRPPFYLFVAGDAGVFVEMEGKWVNVSGNLPSVVVSDLVYHDRSRTLSAATYGRGIWRIRIGKLRAPAAPVGRPSSFIRIASGLREDPAVPAPVLLTPADRAVFDIFPRKTVVTVKPVPEALGYQVEFQADSVQESFSASSTSPQVEFDFIGQGKGRWRIWAVLPDGLRSRPSQWRSFKYLV